MSELKEKLERANEKIKKAEVERKMTPELQQLINEANAAKNKDELEKLVDQILEKLE